MVPLPVPIAAGILIAAPRLLEKDGPLKVDRRGFDVAGAIAVTVGMLLLVRTVVRAPDVGWGSGETLISFAIAAALLSAFVAIERRAAQPLVRLGILRSASLRRANLGAMAVFGAYVGFQFVATLYMQTLLGWSALGMAFAFLPAGLIVAFGAPRIGALADRFGTERVIVVGGIAFVIGYALFLRIDEGSAYGLTGAVIADDRTALLQIMATLGVPVRRYKLYAAWAVEKAGRLKLNPFSRSLATRALMSDASAAARGSSPAGRLMRR